MFPDTNQATGSEAILCHDNKVGEEPSSSLNHTNLTIRQGYQPEKERSSFIQNDKRQQQSFFLQDF